MLFRTTINCRRIDDERNLEETADKNRKEMK